MDEIASKNPDYDMDQVRATCGKLQRDLGGSVPQHGQKVMSYEDNGRLFIKMFLLDGNVNLNDWGVRQDSIAKNITSAIGKPVVLHKNAMGQFDHPHLNDKDINHAMAYQDLFRIGTFVDVFEDPNDRGKWYGVAEVTDEGFRKALKEDPSIPFYVSPTIRLMTSSQDDRDIADWQYMHTAIVDRPAYGVHRAYIGSNCSGDQNTCLLQLRKASIAANGGKVGCGFCTYDAAKELQKLVRTTQNDAKTISSQSLNSVKTSSVNNLLTNNYTASEGEAKEETKTEVKRKVDPVTGETEIKEKTETKSEGEQKNASNKELLEQIERLSTRNKELELTIQTASSDRNSLQTIVGKLNDEVTKLREAAEAEAKENRYKAISDIVMNSAMFHGLSQEDKQKQIDNYMTSSWSEEQIKQNLSPIEENFKKASLNAGQQFGYQKLQLGNNRTVNNAVLETKSASVQDGELPYYLQFSRQMFTESARRSPRSGGVQ